MATRAEIEAELVARGRVALIAADIAADPVADEAPRPYLNGPIRKGLSALGYATADPFLVADADLAAVAAGDMETLLDAAELAVMERAYVSITDVDVRTTDVDQKRSQYADRLLKWIERKRAELAAVIGVDVPTLTAGVIDLGFGERDDGDEFA